MNSNDQIIEVKKLIQDKRYDEAEQLLLSMLLSEKTKSVEDENNTHYLFNNYIEKLLFLNIYKPKKKNVEPDVNYAQIYFYLGFISVDIKKYDKALQYYKKCLEWNPVNVSTMFEIANIYKNLGEIEKYKAQIEKAHSYIYESNYMAAYYSELGWYYTEKKIFDLANALYTQSIGFLDTNFARQGLAFIAKQENRDVRLSTKEETINLFSDYNICNGFNMNVVNMIFEEYQRLSTINPQPNVVRYLSQRLYDITLDRRFMTYYELKDEIYAVRVLVPDTWKYLEKKTMKSIIFRLIRFLIY